MSKATWTRSTAARAGVGRRGSRRWRRGRKRRSRRAVMRWARGVAGCGERREVVRGRPPRGAERRVPRLRSRKSLRRVGASCVREWRPRGRVGRSSSVGESRDGREGRRESQSKELGGRRGKGGRRLALGHVVARAVARTRAMREREEEREILVVRRMREEREEGSGPSPQWNFGRRRRITSRARRERPRVAGRGEIRWWEEKREYQAVWRGEGGEEGEDVPSRREQE